MSPIPNKSKPLRIPHVEISPNFSMQEWMAIRSPNLDVDLERTPPNPVLVAQFPLQVLMENSILPWQLLDGQCYCLVADDDETSKAIIEDYVSPVITIPFPRDFIQSQLLQHFKEPMLEQARDYCPQKQSARSLSLSMTLLCVETLALCVAVAAILANIPILHSLLALCVCFTIANSSLRFLALFQRDLAKKKAHVVPFIPPKISILVPLFKEERVLTQIIRNVSRLEYPKSCLEIKLLLEETDELTQRALKKMTLPEYVQAIIVPTDHLQTKPKAMNYALPFCSGELIGIYDAEDDPESDQLNKVVSAFSLASENTACMQCELDFFNLKRNWFSRCFTIEYRIWFSSVLPIVQKLNMAVPLGGTSLFIKRDILEQVGGWDAYNVTEDADLGIRLKRAGFETGVVHSKTWEEANTRLIPWIKQRSRWLKGYLVTWIMHMKNPRQLWRDLGTLGFIGVNIMFLGAIINALALPLYLLMWGSLFGYDIIGFGNAHLSFKLFVLFGLTFAQVSNIALAFKTLYAEERTKFLFKWYLTMSFYWPLGTIAVYKAIYELIAKPYYWDKTEHGFDKSKRRRKKRSKTLPKAPLNEGAS